MARKSFDAFASSCRRFVKQVFGSSKARSRRGLRGSRRRLLFESLEGRAVMATNLGEITGRIFVDATGNGYTAGEQVVGATVELYTDNGDNAFNIGTDTLTATATTDANGIYDFTGRTAGSYFVRQPAQVVGATSLGTVVSSIITITALEAQGVTGTSIDTFATVGPTVTAAFPIGSTNAASLAAAEALGGERDLFVELTAGAALDSVSFSGGAGQLNLNPTFTARGRYVAVWDGIDGAAAVAANGLGGLDLTTAGTINAIRLSVGVDQPGATIQFRLHSGAGNVSSSTATAIPVGAPTELIIPFTSFTTTSGTGGSFANAGALEMEVITTTDATDGQVTVIGLIGPTIKTQNFDNCADVGITKSVDNAAPIAGQNVTFTVTVSNAAGVGLATSLVVTDQLPAGLTFVSSTASAGTYNNGTGIWSVGNLSAGSSATLQIVATVGVGGTLTNAASITSLGQCDMSANNNTASAVLAATALDLAVTKTVDDSTPNRNQNVTFTVGVQNIGTAAATAATISDVLPAGLTFVSANTATGSFNNGTGVWTIGALAANASASLTIVATNTTVGAKTNTAAVASSTPGDINAANDSASVTLTPNAVDLSLLKTVDNSTPNQNQNVTFTITLANAGPAQATNITVSDTLPTGITFVSATPSSGTYNNGTGVWTVSTLNSGSSATLTMVGTVATSGAKTNTATVTAVDQFDTSAANDTASVTVTPRISDVAVAKTVNDATPDKNQNVTFTITASNLGPDNATNVTITDTLPTGITFVSSTPSTGTYNSTTGAWVIPTLNVGSTPTLQLVGTVATTGTKTNTATVSAADQFDSSTANNTATAAVVPNEADLSVTKDVNNTTPQRGTNVTFTITVANAGPQTATNAVVTDLLPSGFTFVNSTPSQGTYTAATGVWTVGTINANANATLQVVATVNNTGDYLNSVEVTSVDQFDPDSTPANAAVGEDDLAQRLVTPQRVSKRLYLAE